MVRVAIVFLVFAPQAWSLNVSSVADEAPSLLQDAFQTMDSENAPLAEVEEQVGSEFQNLDGLVDNLENPPQQDGHESLDETQPDADANGIATNESTTAAPATEQGSNTTSSSQNTNDTEAAEKTAKNATTPASNDTAAGLSTTEVPFTEANDATTPSPTTNGTDVAIKKATASAANDTAAEQSASDSRATEGGDAKTSSPNVNVTEATKKHDENATASSPNGIAGLVDVDSLFQLQQLEKEESTEENHEVSAIQPEKGDKMPTFPKSFPGCGCDWEGKAWTCKGTIAHPASLQGNECCCCTLSCAKDNRCTNEQCLAIGIDQGPEIAAEEARLKAILGDADTVLEGLPAYKVSLGIGRPNGAKILAVCKAKDMVPLCDSKNYCGTTATCYHPVCSGNPTKSKLVTHHFSSPTTLVNNPVGSIDPTQFYGLAMYANRNNQPYGGAFTAVTMGHSYINLASTIKMFNMQTKKLVKTIPIAQVDSGQALGGWHTLCVKKEATVGR